MDFRGRAYPIPPNLSHIGDDLSRGLLQFSQSKPLGTRGLYWLKVHFANTFGYDKFSFDERAAFADQHLEDISDSAKQPLKVSISLSEQRIRADNLCANRVSGGGQKLKTHGNVSQHASRFTQPMLQATLKAISRVYPSSKTALATVYSTTRHSVVILLVLRQLTSSMPNDPVTFTVVWRRKCHAR